MNKQRKDSKINKIFHYGTSPSNNLFVALIIVLVALASFGLGRLSRIEEAKSPVKITNPASVISSTAENLSEIGKEDSPSTGKYVASKNGTKYHLPWCSGASRMKEENKIWFETKEEAEKAGYEPASNCKGI